MPYLDPSTGIRFKSAVTLIDFKHTQCIIASLARFCVATMSPTLYLHCVSGMLILPLLSYTFANIPTKYSTCCLPILSHNS